MRTRRPQRTLTVRDLTVLALGFSGALTIGALMLASAQVRRGAPPEWEVATASLAADPRPAAPARDGTRDDPGVDTTASPTTMIADAVAAPGPPATFPSDALAVSYRPPGDGWSDGAAPVLVVATPPSPTVDAPSDPVRAPDPS